MSTRIEILKRYLEEDPKDSFLRYALALEFIALNDNPKALGLLEDLLSDDPDYLAAYYMAGKTAEASGQPTKAIAWYRKGSALAALQKNEHALNELNAALNVIEDDN